jgi:copper oxidase (laccase) domain-containing protein
LCYIERLRQGTFRIVAREGLQWLECRAWARFPWLRHAFSTRCGGVSEGPAAGLNLGFITADARANVEEV